MKLINRNGSTLALTLIVFAVLMILGTFILGFMVTENKQAIYYQNKTQAYYIARSGAVAVEATILEMSDDEQSKLFSTLKTNKIENIRIDGLPIINNPIISLELDNNNIIIKSTANVKNAASEIIKVMVSKKKSTALEIDHAIFSKETIQLKNGTIEGDIGTNDSVIVTGNPTLKGDVFLLEGKNIAFPYQDWETNWRKGYGEKRLDSESDFLFFDFPDYPADLQANDNIKTNWDNSNPVIISSGSYDSIIVDQNYSLTIDTSGGDISIRIKELRIPQGKIILLGNNKVTFYVENMYIGGGSTINYNGNLPGDRNNFDLFYKGTSELIIGGSQKLAGNLYVNTANLTITESGGVFGNVFSNGKKVTLSGNSDITKGLLYAPDADVLFSGSGKIYGAIVANQFTITGGGQVYYKPEYFEDDILPIGSGTSIFKFDKPGYFKR